MELMTKLQQIPELVQAVPDLWNPETTMMARHKTECADLQGYINLSVNHLEAWQKIQTKLVFRNCRFIIGLRGFIGSYDAQVVGVYEKEGVSPEPITIAQLVAEEHITQDLADVLPDNNPRYLYDLQKRWDADDLPDDFPQPLMVRWGNTPQEDRPWLEWACKNPKEVIE